MRRVRYTADALKDLKRHGNMAMRIAKAVQDFAEAGAHANSVTRLVGSTTWRLRVGDFRVIFDQDGDTITVIGPRSDVYD